MGFDTLFGLYRFTMEYWSVKCLKTMFIGLLVMGVIFLIQSCNRRKYAALNYYSWFLLFPAAFTGMSKLFFTGRGWYITSVFNTLASPALGSIYFMVAGILFVVFVVKNIRLKSRIGEMDRWEDAPFAEECGRHITVYITKEQISPFSGGIIHPFIVIPKEIVDHWTIDKCRVVLGHELSHIRSGHIVWMSAFRLLTILWWANPLIYLCERKFREDMEIICDKQCIALCGTSPSVYGQILMDMIVKLSGKGSVGTLAFAGHGDYQTLKSRIGALSAAGKRHPSRYKKYTWMFWAVLLLLFGAVAATSYPRYTKLNELNLYNEKLELLDHDSKELRRAVAAVDGKLVVNEENFRTLLNAHHVTGDYVYVGFDTIMKVPGTGGGGDAGMISTEDYSDILYLAADTVENKILIFVLKYVL